MITVPKHLEDPFLHVAEIEHKPVSKLIEMALTELHDARIAKAAIERMRRGESELISLEAAERILDETDD